MILLVVAYKRRGKKLNCWWQLIDSEQECKVLAQYKSRKEALEELSRLKAS